MVFELHGVKDQTSHVDALPARMPSSDYGHGRHGRRQQRRARGQGGREAGTCRPSHPTPCVCRLLMIKTSQDSQREREGGRPWGNFFLGNIGDGRGCTGRGERVLRLFDVCKCKDPSYEIFIVCVSVASDSQNLLEAPVETNALPRKEEQTLDRHTCAPHLARSIRAAYIIILTPRRRRLHSFPPSLAAPAYYYSFRGVDREKEKKSLCLHRNMPPSFLLMECGMH